MPRGSLPPESTLAAIDLGSSSLRVGLVGVARDGLRLTRMARFPNRPLRRHGSEYWDIERLTGSAVDQLRRWAGEFVSVSVDSWSSDYVLADALRGEFRPPQHQRTRARRQLAGQWTVDLRRRLFEQTGAQVRAYSARVLLREELDGGALPAGSAVMLVPDYISWLLSGRVVAERTNASTTALVHEGGWDVAMRAELARAGVELPELVEPGTRLGPAGPELGPGRVEVVAGASHDTAAAVAAMPSTGDDVAFVSCGTWHLVGVETGGPIRTRAAFEWGLTNEYGAGGRNRLISVSQGLWMIDRCLEAWGVPHGTRLARRLLEAAGSGATPGLVFDPSDVGVPEYIDLLAARGAAAPEQRAAVLRHIFESLARHTARALEQLEAAAAKPIRRVHMLGGGSQIVGFAGLVADVCRREVVAGPVEAATLGNALVQAQALAMLPPELDAARSLVAGSSELRSHRPCGFAPATPRVLGPGELQELARDL